MRSHVPARGYKLVGQFAAEFVPGDAEPRQGAEVGQTVNPGQVFICTSRADHDQANGPIVYAHFSAEAARQFAYAVLEQADEADRRLQAADPERYAQGLRDLIQSALNPTPDHTAADGDTIVRSVN